MSRVFPIRPATIAIAAWVWLRRMLGIVEYEHIARGRFGGDNALILWHVASSVDFALVIYAYFDFNFAGN